jgi:tetraacyldisaccharide 4'-kinase
MTKISEFPSKIIESVVRKRNKSFDNGTIPVYKSKKPVISVGNLTFGGSGKTPFTIALASELMKRGFKPGIIGRGYKRTMLDTNIVCDGENIVKNWQAAGDEMFLIAKKLRIPVVVHKKKYHAAKIIEKFDIDVIILDDGFQHRYLARDIDLVIIDSKTIAKPKLPPSGVLREPVDSLERADFILAPGNLNIPDFLSRYCKYPPVRFSIFNGFIYELTSGQQKEPDNRSVIAFCGIANPERFKETLEKDGFNILHFHSFGDHHDYTSNDFKTLMKESKRLSINTFITTEKDAVKLMDYSQYFKNNNMEILVLPITLEINDGKELLFKMIEEILGQHK